MPSDEGIGKRSDHIIQAESKMFDLWTLSFAKFVITPVIGVYVRMCVCTYVCMYIHVCVYVCMYVCVCMCMYLCM